MEGIPIKLAKIKETELKFANGHLAFFHFGWKIITQSKLITKKGKVVYISILKFVAAHPLNPPLLGTNLQ